MRVSDKCLKLVKKWEGCYLKAYQDCVGVWTIGYGITNSDKSITGLTIKKGLKITQKQADSWLEAALNKIYLPKVLKYQDKYNWNQNQIDALVSFAYNIGNIDGLTAHGTRSNSVISNKFLEYNKAGGRKLLGLTNRRKDERKLFLTECASTFNEKEDLILPVLPDESFGVKRRWYQKYDGVLTLKKYPTQIKRVQMLLRKHGFVGKDGKPLEIDGKYMQNTEFAVKSVQKKYGLDVNGKFGEKCLNALILVAK